MLSFASAAWADDVTLDVTAWKGNEAEPAGLAEIIELFEAEHPEIKVEHSYISRSDTDVVIPPRLQGKLADPATALCIIGVNGGRSNVQVVSGLVDHTLP